MRSPRAKALRADRIDRIDLSPTGPDSPLFGVGGWGGWWYKCNMNASRIVPGLVVAALTCLAQGDTVQFEIDPVRTQVTLSGTAAGLAVREQGVGSLTTGFEGYVRAELDGSTIRFLGGSIIDALTNGNWSPLAMGAEGVEPGDFGALASGGFISGTAALRDVVLDLVSDPVEIQPDNTFNADDLLFVFPEGTPSAFDYRVSVFFTTDAGRNPLVGYATNRVANVGSVTTEAGVQTLTIPIEASIVFELLNPDDSTLTIQGQLVATRSAVGPPQLVITGTRLFQGDLLFEWSAAPGDQFRIESSSDLNAWTDLLPVPAGESSWQTPAEAGVAF